MICDCENYEGRFVFHRHLICRAKADLGVFLFCLGRFCKPVMTKPRPPPPKPAATADSTPAEPKDVPSGHAGTAGEVPVPDPMDTDNTSSTPDADMRTD